MDLGDIDGAQKATKMYDSLMKSGKWTAAQNKAEKGEYVDSIGELVAICETDGFVEKLDAGKIGKAGLGLGMGRMNKEDSIDPRVGMIFNKKVGDEVKVGDVLAYVHANSPESANNCVEEIKKAYEIGFRKITKKNIIEII